MTFFTNYTNIALIVIALVSGALLLWPAIMRRGRGGISPAEATTLINRRNAVIVDLRSAAEFAKGHLPQARNVELTELQAKIGQIAKNKSNPVVLVCQTGQESQRASRAVSEAGC